jgi:predicted LPLAT superfamily acyltransferase
MANANALHWAQLKEGGTVFGMRLLLFVHRWGGPLIFRTFLFPVICYYLVFRRQGYRASHEYLARLHRSSGVVPVPRFWHVFAHFWSFGISLLDKMSVWSGRITLADVELHNEQLMVELLRARQGGVLLISHLGNFEICQALSETMPEFRLTVLHHTRHAVKFNSVLNRHKGNSSITLHQVTELDMGVAMQLGEKVSAGQFLALSGDRVAVDNPASSLAVDFLGHSAPFPSGPFVLGLALQAPIITVFCIREAGRYNIYFEMLWPGGGVKRAERKALMNELVRNYAARLEYYCQKAPLQWYNFYSFWH